jgi:hypothetical protein
MKGQMAVGSMTPPRARALLSENDADTIRIQIVG